MSSTIIVGLQWGDEGKGKVVDWLAPRFRHIVRSQGGHNAGHTVVKEGKEFRLHLIPSGILHPDCLCYIGAGVAIDPQHLKKEIADLASQGISCRGRLFISGRAKVIEPHHIQEDQRDPLSIKIGTTKRGIGPCYRDAVGRQVTLFYQAAQTDEELKIYLAPVETLLQQAARRNEPMLLEGAQGALLDINLGTYPFVTSSATCAAGLLAGAGLGPRIVDSVIGVMKAYSTRVGQGPMPTELADCEREMFGPLKEIREIGTTTGRERRIGWFDAVLGRYSVDMNSVSKIALMKLDVLDQLDRIKICVAYELDGERLQDPPLFLSDLERVIPCYEEWPGWRTSTQGIREWRDLPENAKKYIERLSALIECPIGSLSVGPSREQTIRIAD